MDANDAHVACLKQKTNLRRLGLNWMSNRMEEVNTELQHDVLDGLEPPPGIKELEIHWYSGRQYARWMQSQLGCGVQGAAPFPFLRVMKLYNFTNLKHLHGLVELPCLEELCLLDMPSIESISGCPFPSLVEIKMSALPCLGEVWMVAKRTMPDGEEGAGCCNFTPQLGQVILVGNCLTELKISDCPKLEVKPQLPPSLQQLELSGSEQLLESRGQCEGSSSFPCFSHLKKLQQLRVSRLASGKWELLQDMTALETLSIGSCDGLPELPESLGSLTSLRSLGMWQCSAICMLPESLGELQSLQNLIISSFSSLSSLPQSTGHLTSLQELRMSFCDALEQLPECLGELRSLRLLDIADLPGLTCLPQSVSGLTSLQALRIKNCPGLTSLPEGMKGVFSLEKLSIERCLEIKSFPEGIKDLTALKTLRIEYCPSLARRCEGHDWHLVSHIPDLRIS